MKKSILDEFKNILDEGRDKLKKINEEQDLDCILNEAVKKISLLEYEIYKSIPKTACSYREDSGKINKHTLKHAEIYNKPNGKGVKVYSVKIDGRGHDGSSDIKIPKKHANYFRSIGYDIPGDNILESVNFIDDDLSNSKIFILID